MIKNSLPKFLEKILKRDAYLKWLERKARAHRKRDSKYGKKYTLADYKKAIHNAVLYSNGFDEYTGWKLDWNLIGTYRNGDATKGGSEYFRKFKLLPTVDHVNDGRPGLRFKICSWVVNGVKSHLSLKELKDVCKAILKYKKHKYR